MYWQTLCIDSDKEIGVKTEKSVPILQTERGKKGKCNGVYILHVHLYSHGIDCQLVHHLKNTSWYLPGGIFSTGHLSMECGLYHSSTGKWLIIYIVMTFYILKNAAYIGWIC